MSKTGYGDQIFSFAEWDEWKKNWATWFGAKVVWVGPITSTSDSGHSIHSTAEGSDHE